MSHIFVSGSLAYDRIMNFPGLFKEHLVEGKLHSINVSFVVDSLRRDFGGTAGNIAYNLGLLGERPTVIATAGDDFDPARCALESRGVDCSMIHVREGATAEAHVITDRENNQISAFYPGVSEMSYGDLAAEDISLGVIAPGAIEDMTSFAALYQSRGIPYFFDPGQRLSLLTGEQLRACVRGAAAVFVNDYECELLKQKTDWTERDIAAHADMLVVTLGAEGARIITGEQEVRCPGVRLEKVVDPTGAGDAHRAGFIKGHLAGFPIELTGRLANVVASFAVETRGTQNHCFTLVNVMERYERAYGETIVL